MCSQKTSMNNSRNQLRLLKLLLKGKLAGFNFTSNTTKLYIAAPSRSYTFDFELVKAQCEQGLISLDKNKISLTDFGRDKLKSLLNPDVFNNDNLIEKEMHIDNVLQTVSFNKEESPLSRLYYRKDKKGVSYISHYEYQAGERIRQDFERGQLQPKISARLDIPLGGSSWRDSSEISDFAIDARDRFQQAVDSIPPELSRVTVDVCCFLKGFERVEREQKWPRRSGKLMLKTGLSGLARHYGIGNTRRTGTMSSHFWGAEDYRPAIAY